MSNYELTTTDNVPKLKTYMRGGILNEEVGAGVGPLGGRIGHSDFPIGSPERRAELRRQAKARHNARKQAGAPSLKCACGCGQSLRAFDAHGRPRTFINGHNSRDRERYPNEGEFKRAWNHRNRRARAIAKNIRNRKLKVRLMRLHGAACVDCGLKHDGNNACVFHFHHREPREKLFAVGNQLCVKAWRSILMEAAKCDLLCANCHEMRHGGGF